MRRRPFNLATILLLLLLVATAALWTRSYFRDDGWSWGTRTGRAGMESFQGRLTLGRIDVPAAELARIPRGRLFVSVPAARAVANYLKPSWSAAGFQVTSLNQRGYAVRDLRIPYWALLIAAGIPLIVLIAKLRQVPPGHCRKCRYDLTGNVSGVCPECGTEIRQRLPDRPIL